MAPPRLMVIWNVQVILIRMMVICDFPRCGKEYLLVHQIPTWSFLPLFRFAFYGWLYPWLPARLIPLQSIQVRKVPKPLLVLPQLWKISFFPCGPGDSWKGQVFLSSTFSSLTTSTISGCKYFHAQFNLLFSSIEINYLNFNFIANFDDIRRIFNKCP